MIRMYPPPIQAAALFGSCARGDADRLSDRDLLLVGDSETEVRRTGRSLDAKGWSTACFSWSRLKREAAKGSLFVQHLKQDSIVLHDAFGLLQQTLDRFEPDRSYHSEIAECRKLFGAVTHIPRNPRCLGVALDTAAVVFRAILIAELANVGIYEFSTDGLLTQSVRAGILLSSDAMAYRDFRRFKTYHRLEHHAQLPAFADAIRMLERLSKVLGADQHVLISNSETVADNAFAYLSGSRWSSSPYHRLRRIEMALAAWSAPPSLEFDADNALRQLSMMVCKPRDYLYRLSVGTINHSDLLETALRHSTPILPAARSFAMFPSRPPTLAGYTALGRQLQPGGSKTTGFSRRYPAAPEC